MRRLLQFGFAALVLTTARPGDASAQEGSLEFPVKAAFLYRFGSFVEWPPSAFSNRDATVQLCVVGHDPFGASLDRVVRGQTLDGRPIVVRRLPAVGPGSGCHIAYLGGGPEQSVDAATRALAIAPVLTVADGPAAEGAAIQFVIRANRVRFRIDQRAALRSGLTISSKLLNIAVEVVR